MKRDSIGLDSGYSQRFLARLAFSAAAAELADASRNRVSTESDRSAEAGEFIVDAAALLGLAETVLQRAVVLERERGTSWAQIGEALNASKQAAQQRFGPAVDEWRNALDEPLVRGRGGIYSCRLPAGPDSPELAAARLNRWVKRHRDRTEPECSVKPELAPLTEQVASLLRVARRMVGEKDPLKRRQFLARKALVLKGIAAARPDDAAALDAAARAVEQLSEVDED